jgi:hypothetical protein
MDISVSAKAREKCIQRARERLASEQKWGRWFAALQLLAGLAYVVLGIILINLLQVAVHDANLGRVLPLQNIAQNVAWQNLVWSLFTLGLMIGAITGGALIVGGYHFFEGITILRGDPASRLLVEYHDALLQRMHDYPSPLPTHSENAPPRSDALLDANP